MNKSFKVRIYPTRGQQVLLEKTFGANRFIYNYFLNLKSKLYEFYKISLNNINCSKVLTELKKQKTWLKEVDAVSLQQTLRDLDSAYQNFFNGRGKYPKFKRKDDKNSYRANMNLSLNTDNHIIKIPKVGSIRFRDKSRFRDVTKIYSITISKSSSGKYFASISADVNIKHFERTNQSIGIDLGLKDFIILNTGEKIHNPRILKSLEVKYRKLAKSLSRKVRGSANYQKARVKLARFHEYVANIRKDFLHKLTLKLVKTYDIICIENLNVSGLIKNHKLAKAFQDVSLYEFVRQLEYKTKWYGKIISKIDRFYPSSQLCSNCGYKNRAVKNLKIREWACPECNVHHDRDINSAINILNEGLRLLEGI